MLVSTEWLSAHLNDPKLVILHVGSPADYDSGHIPGARLVRLAHISVTVPIRPNQSTHELVGHSRIGACAPSLPVKTGAN